MALVAGFGVGILAAFLLTVALRAFDLGPEAQALEERAQTFFISHPDTFSVLVALLAGTAGMLSLLTARSGALIGVLISVTTIPAAANIGVAAAYRNWAEFRGAALQLAINLGALVIAGIATLLVEAGGLPPPSREARQEGVKNRSARVGLPSRRVAPPVSGRTTEACETSSSPSS